MPILKRNGYEINYQVEGPAGAPVLLFSNSLGADLSMWDAQAEAFNLRFRVVRYDNRGHGKSTAPPGEYTIKTIASDAVALLEFLSPGMPAYFCGLSLGGMVGMWIGAQRQDLLRKLVLCNTSALMGPKETWQTRIKDVREGGMAAVVKTVMERWFTPDFRQRAPRSIAPIEQAFLNVDVNGYIGCCAAIRDMDQRAALMGISTPTLVIAGTHAPPTPPAMGQSIAQAIPGSRYVEFPTAHLSNVEAASSFNGALAHFLT